MTDGKNSHDAMAELSRLTKEKERLLASDDHKRLLGLRSELKEVESAIKNVADDLASEFSMLKKPLKKFQRHAVEHSKIIDDYAAAPLKALMKDYSLKIINVLSEMSHYIKEKGLCSKDKRAAQALKTIQKMDSGYLKAIIEKNAELSKKKENLTEDINSISIEQQVNDINVKIKQLRHEAEQAKNEPKKQEKTKRCPRCAEQIPADWLFHKTCGWKDEKQETEEDEGHGRSRILVFTSPTCPHCPHALRLAKEVEKEREDVRVTEISTGTPSGKRKAEQMEVMAVPTLFVKGPAYPQNIGLKGVPSKKGLVKAIDISLGLAEWEEPKGLFKSLLDKLPLKIKW